jgi:hypothetical protein
MKHIVCYSGGVQSALVAIMVVERFGKESVVLLNHRVNAEPSDIERFEKEVAVFLKIDITYADADLKKYPSLTPLEVSIKENAWGIKTGGGEQVLCTNRLKTAPFMKWLEVNYEEGDVIYYGFDKTEQHRITRRSYILGKDGYKTDYPLALWEKPYLRSYLEKIGIALPLQYGIFKHANCVGCIKAGKQHWYCIYVHANDVFEEFKKAEQLIGHHIQKGIYLEELEVEFEKMKQKGIPATEHIPSGEFWSLVKKNLKEKKGLFDTEKEDTKPCECLV